MKTYNEILQDLMEIVHFTESVSAKIHSVLQEDEVYRVVKEEFARSGKYTISILLLTDDGEKVRLAETSLAPEKRQAAEMVSGAAPKEYEIDLKKSSIYRCVVKEEKTIIADVDETIEELFTPPIAHLISRALGYGKKSILTPLYKQGNIIGALAMSSTDLSQYLIPSVKNLAQHISHALEMAYERSEREKEVEEALKESENLLSNILDQSPFSTWIADINGTNIRQNAACRKLLGIDYDEQTVGKYNIFCDPVLKEHGVTEELRKVFVKGETIRFTIDYDFSRVENVNVPNATHKSLQVTIFPVKNRKGKVVNAVVQHEDITERKKAEETLKESEQRYHTLFDSTVNPVLVIDAEGHYISCNEAALRFVECTRGELLKKNIRDFIPPGKDKELLEKHKLLWENGGSTETEYYIHGKSKILELTITPGICRGKRVAFGVGRDITDRKKAEEEKEKLQAQLIQSAKMAALGTLGSGITHEFSNLLQIMIGHVAFALRTRRAKDMEDALNVVSDTSDKATKIIRYLSSFSGQEVPGRELCDVAELLESVLLLMDRQLKKNNIKVVRKYERIPVIEMNKEEIQQVFLAIVINARDAMLSRGGKLEIRIRQVKENIEITFSDTGEGIRKENLSKVFEPFFTTKGSSGNGAVPGMGLGLSVCYGIIQRHRGTIEVNSEAGRGAIFVIKFPVGKIESEKRVIKKQGDEQIGDTQRMNILVMDDEEEICKILINWLSAKGHRVKYTLGGKEAIELARNEHFNVAFLDIIMPGIPGNIVLEEIKKISPKTRVIMITGKIMSNYLLNALREKGAYECIQKPFGIEEINRALA